MALSKNSNSFLYEVLDADEGPKQISIYFMNSYSPTVLFNNKLRRAKYLDHSQCQVIFKNILIIYKHRQLRNVKNIFT